MNGNTQHLSFFVFHGQAAKQEIVLSQFSSECEQDSSGRLQGDCALNCFALASLVFRLCYQRWRREKAPCLSCSLLWGLTRVDFSCCFGAAQLLNTTGLIYLLHLIVGTLSLAREVHMRIRIIHTHVKDSSSFQVEQWLDLTSSRA